MVIFLQHISKHVTTSQILGRSPIERRQHPSMTIDVESGLTNARRGARINTGQSGIMMQLGKGPSNSVAVTLHEFAWLLVLRGVNMPCSRTTGCCQCHGDRLHDLRWSVSSEQALGTSSPSISLCPNGRDFLLSVSGT